MRLLTCTRLWRAGLHTARHGAIGRLLAANPSASSKYVCDWLNVFLYSRTCIVMAYVVVAYLSLHYLTNEKVLCPAASLSTRTK